MGEKSPERLALETKAEALGVEFGWNIGDEKLAERVAEAEAEAEGSSPTEQSTPPETAEGAATDQAPHSQDDRQSSDPGGGAPMTPPPDEVETTANWDLLHNGQHIGPRHPVTLSRADYEQLRAAGAVAEIAEGEG